MKKVVVVGATGLVGSNIVKMLEERNFPVADVKFLVQKNLPVKKSNLKIKNTKWKN